MNGNDEERGHEFGKKTKGRHDIHLMAGEGERQSATGQMAGALA
jgi:hypothetical protein